VRVYYLHDGNPDIEARLMFKDHDGRMGATSCARERTHGNEWIDSRTSPK